MDYSKLRQTYKLPSIKALEKNFDFDAEDLSKPILRSIRKRMFDRLDYFCEILENILHPNSGLAGLYECKFFDDNEKEKLFSFYKRLMFIKRTALDLSIENNEKKDAEFIKSIYKKWKNIKREMFHVTKNLKKGWEREKESKSKLEYLG